LPADRENVATSGSPTIPFTADVFHRNVWELWRGFCRENPIRCQNLVPVYTAFYSAPLPLPCRDVWWSDRGPSVSPATQVQMATRQHSVQGLPRVRPEPVDRPNFGRGPLPCNPRRFQSCQIMSGWASLSLLFQRGVRLLFFANYIFSPRSDVVCFPRSTGVFLRT